MAVSPKLSVVVAVLNGAEHIERCIVSFAKQTFVAKELIIIDGGSTDGTIEILKKYEANISFWESQQDSGISSAWNKGLSHATGEWICFLGADDHIYDNNVFERMSPHLVNACPHYSIVYGKVSLVNKKGLLLGIFGEPWERMRGSFVGGKDLYIHQAMFHHRSLFDRYGEFDESFQIASDYEFLLRELINNDPLYVPQTVTVMQYGGRSSSPMERSRCINEIIRARRMHGLTDGESALFLARLRAGVHAMLYRLAGRRISSFVADGYRLLVGKDKLWTRDTSRSVDISEGQRKDQ